MAMAKIEMTSPDDSQSAGDRYASRWLRDS
jgi:hypothetical protein